MAPTKKTMNVTAMLKKKGFNPKEHDVDTVLDVEGVEYVVKMTNGKKVFELFNAELEKEEYDEPEPEPEDVNEPEEVNEPEVDDDVDEPEEADKPEEADEPEEVNEPVIVEAKPPKKKATKKASKKAQAEPEEHVDEVPKAPKAKKASKKDNDDEKKPRKTRSPTAYNKFIQEKMFEFKETEPDMIGTARFAKATQAWKNMDKAAKDKYTADFKAIIVAA
jgi:hypothetical protein